MSSWACSFVVNPNKVHKASQRPSRSSVGTEFRCLWCLKIASGVCLLARTDGPKSGDVPNATIDPFMVFPANQAP